MPVRRRKKQKGRGLFDVIKKVVGVVKPIDDMLKSTKLISKIGSMVPDPRAKAAVMPAAMMGYAKKKRGRPRKQRGGFGLPLMFGVPGLMKMFG